MILLRSISRDVSDQIISNSIGCAAKSGCHRKVPWRICFILRPSRVLNISSLGLCSSVCHCEPGRYSGVKMRLHTAVLLLLAVLTFAAETPTYPQCAVRTIPKAKTEKKNLIDQLDCKQDTSCLDTSCLCTANQALSSCITANCTTREELSMHHHITTSRLSETNWKQKPLNTSTTEHAMSPLPLDMPRPIPGPSCRSC